jgi:hypothetical protein
MDRYSRTLVEIKKREGVETPWKEQRLICMSDFGSSAPNFSRRDDKKAANRRAFVNTQVIAAFFLPQMRMDLFPTQASLGGVQRGR